MKIIFNTGRYYTNEGQVITAIQNETAIHFADHSRAVHGSFPSSSPLEPRDLAEVVVRNYDRGSYNATPESQALERDMNVTPPKIKGVVVTPRRQLISRDEAVDGKAQHTKPCSDCPWARTALNGWLGGASIDEWLMRGHTDTFVDCHTIRNTQCAGLAIYRRNVCKSVQPPLLKLDRDTETCFATPTEFREHHSKFPSTP